MTDDLPESGMESVVHRSGLCRAGRAILIPTFLGVVLTGVVLVGAELALRFIGYGHPAPLYVPSSEAGEYRDNPSFGRRFFPGSWTPDTAPTRVAVPPGDDVFRVAVLGESAAYGYPDPAFGLPRMLQALLEERLPKRKVEVINAALSGVSTPILKEVLRDVLLLQPDLLVFYIGNNEFIGPYGAANPAYAEVPPAWLVKLKVLASRFRLAQWVRAVVPSAPVNPAASPMDCLPLPTGNPAIAATHARYADNLSDMLDAAARAGVPVVLCTVAVNSARWAPFGNQALSEVETQTLQEVRWRESAAQGSDSPVFRFRYAQALEAANQAEEAARHFSLACDSDPLRFRATQVMAERVRGLAESHSNNWVRLADMAGDLPEEAGTSVRSAHFYDHCHFTAEGNFLVANAVLTAAGDFVPAGAPGTASLESVQRRLGWTAWHERENLKYVRYQATKPPYVGRVDHDLWCGELDAEIARLDAQLDAGALDAAVEAVTKEVEAREDDPFLRRNLAQVLMAKGDHDGAAAHLQSLVDAHPDHGAGWVLLARCLAEAERGVEAANAWCSACAVRPERRDWQHHHAAGLAKAGQQGEAQVVWRGLAESQPSDIQAWWLLGQSYESDGNPTAASNTYREGLAHNPDNADLHYYLAKALAANGETEEALAVASRGVELAPDNAGLKRLREELSSD